jgi:hypothetical protein
VFSDRVQPHSPGSRTVPGGALLSSQFGGSSRAYARFDPRLAEDVDGGVGLSPRRSPASPGEGRSAWVDQVDFE